MIKFAPLLMLLLVAGHALAGSGATASHAPVEPVALERIATVALALLLVLGLARLQRKR